MHREKRRIYLFSL